MTVQSVGIRLNREKDTIKSGNIHTGSKFKRRANGNRTSQSAL